MQNNKNDKIKFYLRGLATGIAVSVAVMGITIAAGPKASANPNPDDPSKSGVQSSQESEVSTSGDQQSSEESSETDPTESSVTEPSTEPTESSESNPTDEPTDTTETASSDETNPTETETSSEEETGTDESSDPQPSVDPTESTEQDPTQTSEVQNGDVVVIIIQKGNSSYTVAKKLADAGLVEDAKAYDAYLCRNGYDKRISVGTFEIAPGSTQEEIAKIISRSK